MPKPWLITILMNQLLQSATSKDFCNARSTFLSLNLSGMPTCSENTTFLESFDGRRLDLAPPNCKHEIAVRLLWPSISRSDVVDGKIVDGAYYSAEVDQAASEAIAFSTSYADLQEIRIYQPGMFFFEDKQHDAEIHLNHKGGNAAGFKVVFLVDKTDTPLDFFDWWADDETPACNWVDWLKGFFSCPKKLLPMQSLLPVGQDALRYQPETNCQPSFVILTPLRATTLQLADLRNKELSQADSEVRVTVKDIVLTQVMPPWNYFTVFSSDELANRRLFFGSCFVAAGGMMALAALIGKTLANDYEIDFGEFAFPKSSLVVCMIADHWLSYLFAILIPMCAYHANTVSRVTGMPYEYHAAFVAWLFLHSLHEAYWLTRFGSWSSRLSCATVVMNALLGPVAILDFELDVLFCLVARQAGSRLWMVSALIFAGSNLFGQLFFFTFVTFFMKGGSTSPLLWSTLFKARGHENLHRVWFSWFKQGAKSAPDGSSLGAISTFVLIKTLFEDLFQAVVQALFCFWFGGSTVIYASIGASLLVSFLGAVAAIADFFR